MPPDKGSPGTDSPLEQTSPCRTNRLSPPLGQTVCPRGGGSRFILVCHKRPWPLAPFLFDVELSEKTFRVLVKSFERLHTLIVHCGKDNILFDRGAYMAACTFSIAEQAFN